MRIAPMISAIALLAGCHSQPSAQRNDTPTVESFAPLATIQSSSIDLPSDDETFGEGPHADLLNQSCMACHSAAMVRYQPPLTRKQWSATVDKMREAYGAPFDKAQTGAIVDALVATQPTKP